MQTVRDIDWKEQRALLRVDFNVPLDKGAIADDTRIRASLPTIQYILERGGSIVLMSHLGRPQGHVDSRFSLRPCAERLGALLGRHVVFVAECVGPAVKKVTSQMTPGDLVLLENLRFHGAEEHPSSDPLFAKELAQWGDVYVDDAFGCAHRPHSSIVPITHYFPHKKVAGLLLEQEIAAMHRLLSQPARPFYAVVGGAKISTKLGVLRSLLEQVDKLFLGGAMASTLLAAQGTPIGASLWEPESLGEARKLIALAEKRPHSLVLPLDLVVASAPTADAATRIVSVEEGVPEGWHSLDLGPRTIAHWTQHMGEAKTIFWNGPLGLYELTPFAQGTQSLATAIGHASAYTVVGGGDSVAAVEKMGLASRFSHVSTGGGASLEYLEYGSLPGITALNNS